MKKLILTISVLVVVLQAVAQQVSLFNLYTQDPLHLNVAYAGSNCTQVNLHYRNQWQGFKDAPVNLQLNAQSAFGENNGLALKIGKQSAGLLGNMQVMGGYAYRFKITEKTTAHLGLGLGWNQISFNSSKAVVVDGTDASLTSTQQRLNSFDSEFGAMVQGKKFLMGVSALHLYNSSSKFKTSAVYKQNPQFNIMANYSVFQNQKLDLRPWLLFKKEQNGASQLDAILNAELMNTFSAGIGYRTGYGMLAIIGVKYNYFRFGYSFDFVSGSKVASAGSSHQLMCGFNICKAKKPELPAEDKSKQEAEAAAKAAEEQAKLEQKAREDLAAEAAKAKAEQEAKAAEEKAAQEAKIKADAAAEADKAETKAAQEKAAKENQAKTDEAAKAKAEQEAKSPQEPTAKEKADLAAEAAKAKAEIKKNEAEVKKKELADAKLKATEEVKAKKEAEQKAKQEAIEKVKLEQAELVKAKKEAKEKAKAEKEADALRTKEEKERLKAEEVEKHKAEAKEKARQEALANATQENQKLALSKFASTKEAIQAMNKIAEDVSFETNLSTLDSSNLAHLDLIAEIMKGLKGKVKVIGYTDDKGTEQYNMVLAEDRALYVKRYLKSKGVKTSKFMNVDDEEESKKWEMLYQNDSSKNRAKNRTVRFDRYIKKKN